MYIYPDNLKSKATLWLWELRDIGIVGIGCLISVFALAQLGFILPIVFTAAYAFFSNLVFLSALKLLEQLTEKGLLTVDEAEKSRIELERKLRPTLLFA